MNKLCCLIVMFITCGICKAQNLVPNGDFEGYFGCPAYINQLDSALFWFNPTIATPDYYNQCSSPSDVGVPYNYFGFQPAHSGAGYCGIHPSAIGVLPNYREYIEVPLIVPLAANTCYQLEMYISLGNICKYTTDAVGAYFSDTVITGLSTYETLLFVPQIINSAGNFPDTANWQLVSGNFTAAGGENYLIIGNFMVDSITNNVIVYNGGAPFSYIYIDDVLLSACTGMEEQNSNAEITIYPNPFTDNINIILRRNKLTELNLYDFTARKLFKQSFTNSTSINTEQLAKGIYLYEVKNKNSVIKKGKVVKD